METPELPEPIEIGTIVKIRNSGYGREGRRVSREPRPAGRSCVPRPCPEEASTRLCRSPRGSTRNDGEVKRFPAPDLSPRNRV